MKQILGHFWLLSHDYYLRDLFSLEYCIIAYFLCCNSQKKWSEETLFGRNSKMNHTGPLLWVELIRIRILNTLYDHRLCFKCRSCYKCNWMTFSSLFSTELIFIYKWQSEECNLHWKYYWCGEMEVKFDR